MHLLKAEKITHYFGGLCALSDFELNLRRGELVGIIGPNGAGKTTAFNLITGVYRPDAGKLLFAGVDITGKTPHERTKLGIARTFQNIRLFKELTVLENIRVACYAQASYHVFEALLHVGRYRGERNGLQIMPWTSLPPSSWITLPGKNQKTSPMVRSGASKLPGRSRPGPSCCCWMSRRPG